MGVISFTSFLSNYSRCLILILTPLVLLPVPLTAHTTAGNCAYVVLVMMVYWVTNSLHLAIVSLFPVAFFPLFGVMNTNDVCMTYMKDTNMVYLACLSVGIALEYSGFHRRVAVYMLLKIGTSPRMLLVGIMFVTMAISMWILNTVAAALMIPIVDAVFHSLENVQRQHTEATVPLKLLSEPPYEEYPGYKVIECGEKLDVENDSESSIMRYKKCVLLSVAYAANIGGIGTLTGTSPNIVFSQLFTTMYGFHAGMSYANWLLFGVPAMILCTGITCVLLQLIFIERNSSENSKDQAEIAKSVLEKEYSKLGPLTFHEVAVVSSFFLLVLLYFFRRPHFMSGWESMVNSGKHISDAVPAIFVVIMMCLIPTRPCEAFDMKRRVTVSTLLNWDTIHNKIPWDLILLQGCGYAMAAGFKESGLNMWLGTQFIILETLPTGLICIMVSMLASFTTEVASNASTAAILLPVVGRMAENLRVHPLYFMIPVAICCSFSFMLPIATGPNAMVFKACNMKTKDMLSVGFMTNCLCVLMLYILLNTLGVQVYNLNSFPAWADTASSVVKNTTMLTFVANGTFIQ